MKVGNWKIFKKMFAVHFFGSVSNELILIISKKSKNILL